MPQIPGFVGGSYTGRSIIADNEISYNLYPSAISSGHGNGGSGASLVGTPGLKLICTLPEPPNQGSISTGDRFFYVSGGFIYELTENPDLTLAFTFIGAVGTTLPVSMATNGTQIVIVWGTLDGTLVDLTPPTPTAGPITSPNFRGGSTVAYQDGYFIVAWIGTRRFTISALNDGSTWDALDYAEKSGAPDPISAVFSIKKVLWLLGTETAEPWWNSGNNNFPFQPIQGQLLNSGCAAPLSAAAVDDQLFWLGANKLGHGIVWAAQDFTPVRVSTDSIESAIQKFSKDSKISDAFGSSYQEAGETFYKLDFPSAGVSLVYGKTVGVWHHRGYWDAMNGKFGTTRGRYHSFAFGRHIVGDWQNGNVYEQSLDFLDDNGAPIRRVRRVPHISTELREIRHGRVQMLLQRGIVPQFGQGSNPLFTLRYSDDGGFTWSSIKKAYAGKVGRYKSRVIWRMLGSSRDRVYEFISSEPIPHVWVDAYVNDELGTEVSG